MDQSHLSRVLLWTFILVLVSFTTVFGKKAQDILNHVRDQTRRVSEDFKIRRSVGPYLEVSGQITFKGKAPENIPPNSRLKVELIDIQLQDASHIQLASTLVDLSNYKNTTPLSYNLTSKKPSDLHDMHSITAVLNMGWTPKGGENDEWLRHGDYHTTYNFLLNVTSGTDKFVRDIEMEMFMSSTSAVLGEMEMYSNSTPAAVLGGKIAIFNLILLMLLAALFLG